MSQAGIINIAGGGGGGAPITTITGNTGGPVPPTANNINIIGDNLSVVVSGTPGTSTELITVNNGGFVWNDRAISFLAANNNGYYCTGTLTVTLPATTALYMTVIVYVDTASTVTVVSNAGQFIQIGVPSPKGPTSIATSSQAGDVLYLNFRPVDSTWHAISAIANGWIGS